MRFVFPFVAMLLATPAVAQNTTPAPAPSLEQQLDTLGMDTAQKVFNLINLAKSQDATIKQLMAQNNALTKERDDLKAAAMPKSPP